MSFVNLAKKWIRKLPRPDLLYITSTPLTTGLIGLWAKKKFALPYIFEVRDLWPEAPIQIGVIRNPLLKKILYKLELDIYKHAFKIVALSPGIADYIRKKSPSSSIALIPNFSDLAFFSPSTKDPQVLQSLALKNEFTIAYTGAIGKVNAVKGLLDLAKISLEKGRKYQFVCMGKGSHEKDLKLHSQKMGLTNFHFLPYGNKDQVKKLLSVSDVAYISFDQLPVLKTNSPNKFFDAIAAGKVIIINHQGWVYNLVKTFQLGMYHDIQKPQESFELLDNIALNSEELIRLQKNSRKLAEQYFSKELAVQRLLTVLDPKTYGREFKDEVYILTA